MTTLEYKRVAKKVALSFSKPMPDAKLRVISLGAGVQSSVLALMAAKGEIGPMPDCAIFADTQWEPKEVYTHLDWLETQLPFPVHRVTAGNIRADHVAGVNTTGQRFTGMPMFTPTGGMIRRQCTSEYKIHPVTKKLRELLGLKYRQRAPKVPTIELWMGISTDEIQRMKQAHHKWLQHRWPLMEEGMSRRDCLAWFNRDFPDKPLERSACVGCPFNSNAEWRRIRDTRPDDWEDAVEFDRLVRKQSSDNSIKEDVFLHRSCVPLDEVDLSTAADKGQQEFGFLEECDGMCGI